MNFQINRGADGRWWYGSDIKIGTVNGGPYPLIMTAQDSRRGRTTVRCVPGVIVTF